MKIIGEGKPMSQKEFVEYKGEWCPFCNNEEIITDSIDMGVTKINKCCHCENMWVERTKLVGYRKVEKGDAGVRI